MTTIPTERRIVKLLRRIVFGKRVKCPHCVCRRIIWYEREGRWFCKRCRRKFSLKSVSWLRNMKLGYAELWSLLGCWQAKSSVQRAMAETNLSERAVRHWYGKFRSNLPRLNLQLRGNVEVDELYFNRGAGVLGALERERGMPVLWVPPGRPDKDFVRVFLDSAIHPDSHIFTDKSPFYRDVRKWGFAGHSSENHSKFEFGKTSRMEGIWGVLRTFIRRMYHHIWVKNAPEYVAEFNVRFCQREIFESPLAYLKKCLPVVPT
jgi:transposase-like protein